MLQYHPGTSPPARDTPHHIWSAHPRGRHRQKVTWRSRFHIPVRVRLAQLLQQLRKLFWVKLCQRVCQNIFTSQAAGRQGRRSADELRASCLHGRPVSSARAASMAAREFDGDAKEARGISMVTRGKPGAMGGGGRRRRGNRRQGEVRRGVGRRMRGSPGRCDANG
jgi:hypothetical protein